MRGPPLPPCRRPMYVLRKYSGDKMRLSTFSTRRPFFETFALKSRRQLVRVHDMAIDIQTDPITPKFIESMVDKVIDRITKKLAELDISLDYVAAALLDTTGHDVKVRQRAYGRGSMRPKAPAVDASDTK